jgi:hypothetical protein
MELQELLKNGWLLFITLIDWVWVASFIFTAWVVVRIVGKSNLLPKVDLKVRKLWVVIGWACIWGLFFGFNKTLRLVYLQENLQQINYFTVWIFSFFGAIAIHEIIPLSKYLDKIFGVKPDGDK